MKSPAVRRPEVVTVFLTSGLEPETEDALADALPGVEGDALFLVFRDVAAIVRAWVANASNPAPTAQETHRHWRAVMTHAAKLTDALDALGGATALAALDAAQPMMIAPVARPDANPYGEWATMRDRLLTVALTAGFFAGDHARGGRRDNAPLRAAVGALKRVFARANVETSRAGRRRCDFVLAALGAAPLSLWSRDRDEERLVRDYIRRD